jgi:C1A family cysteine protease
MPLLPSKRKGLGAKIEGPSQTKTYALDHLGLGKVPYGLDEYSLEKFIPKVDGQMVVLNQGATSSCVAHAFVAAIHIAETRAGLPYVPCSRLFAYYNSRKEEGASVITDDGTFLRTCAAGLRHFGLPDEKEWPFSEFTFKVNRRPSYTAYRIAQPRANGQYAKIYQTGVERIAAIKQAIFAGHAVTFGTLVSESFLDNYGDTFIVDDKLSPIAGGHAMCIIGWKRDAGGTWLRVLNSWGTRWRDAGLCWMHEDIIGGAKSDDFHIILGWNRLKLGGAS